MKRLIGKMAGTCPGLILRLRCLKRLKRWPSFKRPHNLFEQMMALALKNKDNPLWATVADKVLIHQYVIDNLGVAYTNKLYGVWSDPDDIDIDALPDRFVLKTNNSCGTNIIVDDKSRLDLATAKRLLRKWLAFPYGQLTGQMHYAHIKPAVLAEEMIENTHADESKSLVDYKFICFHGKPVLMYIYYNREVNSHRPWCKLYDIDGHLLEKYMLPEDLAHPDMPLPASFGKMVEAATVLSKPFELVRVDFYEVGDQPVLGEISLTPGLELTTPEFLTDMQQLYLSTKE